ncbi:hypothetical protein [Sabulicella rubraurantiaca]|uniref:hypothetical protein n=1 Tax=Sabulicella rubraurantiaca TaxID=2811429 RepID=UPI001A96D852|nr:hypothetical protein [Sabulicella rubraurantiaca]
MSSIITSSFPAGHALEDGQLGILSGGLSVMGAVGIGLDVIAGGALIVATGGSMSDFLR